VSDESTERPASELLAERRGKLERLREAGIEPFPHSFPERREIAAVRAEHEGLEPGTESGERVRIAGRIAARRGHGKAAFLDLRDGSAQIQLHSRADVLGEESHERLVGLDLGDFVGVEGEVFATKRGELSVRVEDWMLLGKSLRPLPDAYYGL
jgi:lysyl-tRNA synthetase class 2